VLQKFTVPGGVYLVTVHPVHHKFGEQGLCLGLFDACQPQCLKNGRIGLPIARNPRGFRAVMHLTGVLEPASADMLDEATIDLSRWSAPLAPVEDEFCSHRFGKDDIDACLSQYVERVLTGRPVSPKRGWGGDLKGVRGGLL